MCAAHVAGQQEAFQQRLRSAVRASDFGLHLTERSLLPVTARVRLDSFSKKVRGRVDPECARSSPG